MNKKCKSIIDISTISESCSNKINIISSALYVSAKGTKHFYETLELLSEVNPDNYKQEFELHKQSIKKRKPDQ